VDVFEFSREVNDKSGQTVLDRLSRSRCLLLPALWRMNRRRCSNRVPRSTLRMFTSFHFVFLERRISSIF
jgi:hypothetical protein